MNSFRVYNRIKRLARPPCIRSTRHIQPVFIIGSGRCGTTLLRRILNTGNEIYIPPETYVLGASIREFRSARLFVDWESLCRLAISKFVFSQDYETFPKLKLQPLLERLQSASDDERSCADLIDNLYMSWANSANTSAQRWGDKTPVNVFFLNIIDEAFPEARYVHMVRDSMDVVPSMLNMGRYDSVEAATNRWKQAVLLSRNFGLERKERYLEVRYEDLVQEPEFEVKNVCQFAKLTYFKEMTSDLSATQLMGDVESRDHYQNVTKPIFTDSIGKGKRGLSKTDRNKIREIAGREMKMLGYEL